MLGPSWPLVDEFYQFGMAAWDPARPLENVDVLFDNKIQVGFSRDRVKVLLSIDTELTDMEGLPDMKPGGDYPQAWFREYGKGAPSTPRWGTATISGATTLSSAPISKAASAGHWVWRSKQQLLRDGLLSKSVGGLGAGAGVNARGGRSGTGRASRTRRHDERRGGRIFSHPGLGGRLR